jgi:hypothetical protein
MTFSVTLFASSWICFFIFADKKKFHLFYPTFLFSAFIACAADFFATEHYLLWDYPQGTKIQTYFFHLMQQFGIYPVVTYLFLQTRPKQQITLTLTKHIFYWTILAIVLEWLALKMGFIKHEKWCGTCL